MQNNVRNNEVEVPVREVSALGILLREVHRPSERLSSGMGISKDRGAEVDGMDLGVGKGVDVRQGRVPDRAADVEDPGWGELRVLGPQQVIEDRMAVVVVEFTHLPHGVDVNAPVVNGARKHVGIDVLPAVAARHRMDVDVGVVPGDLQIGVEPQAAERVRRGCCSRCKLIGLANDRVGNRTPQQVLARPPHRAPQTIEVIAAQGFSNLVAVGRFATIFLEPAVAGPVFVNLPDTGTHTRRDVRLEGLHEVLSSEFVVGFLGQHLMTELAHVTPLRVYGPRRMRGRPLLHNFARSRPRPLLLASLRTL